MLQDGESEVIFSLEDDVIQSEFSTGAIEESRTDQAAVSHPTPIIASQENASVSESANVNPATVEISIEVPSLSKIIYEGSGIEEGASSPLEELLEELELEESESESDILSKYGFIPDGYLEKKKRRSVHPSFANVDPLEVESCICSEDSDVLKQSADSGIIDISFPENPDSELIEKYCLPPNYYTLTGKERLLLLFAENFRRQFQFLYPHRRPLVLAVRNECDVQKFVSTTLRPTGFIIPEFIGSLEEITKFVADFIIYEPLENPISLVSHYFSI